MPDTLDDLPARIAACATPLPPPAEADVFAAAFDAYADRRVVLLGEASHGTAEFYQARAAITLRLVERHGFDILALEADWPDAAMIDRHLRGEDGRNARPLDAFQRFPTWMWRNREMEEFVAGLRTLQGRRPNGAPIGVYGLDLYSLGASVRAVIDYLDDVDPEAAEVARERYGCLTPWRGDPAGYGRAALSAGYALCEAQVAAMLGELLERRLAQAERDGARFLDAAQNARLVAAAERYYRTMYYHGPESWNLRDRHMADTLDAVLAARGPGSKAVVWAHNSHIGDPRATVMGRVQGEIALGQLVRERYGAQSALVGFGTARGTVAAADEWDTPMQVMRVREPLPGSIESVCDATGLGRFLLRLDTLDDGLRRALSQEREQRFIGVIYRPKTERASHYMPAALADQYDAWAFFSDTRAVTPLGEEPSEGMPDTYPTGL